MPNHKQNWSFTPPQDFQELSRDLPTLSYREVLDMYDEDRKSRPVFSQMTLPEYAQYQNRAGESQMFDQALTTGVGGLIKRAAAEKSRFIESPAGVYGLVSPAAGLVNQFFGQNKSVPQMVQETAQSLSAPLGEHWSEVIGQAAQGLPESLVNIAPMLAGGPLGVAATAGLTGASTYEQTGSKGQAALSAGTAALIPTVFGKSAQAGLSAAGATLRNEAGQLVGETLGQRAAGYGAGQLGAAGLMELSHQTGQVAAGNGLDLSAEHFVQSAIGQLPFLALDLPNLIQGGQIAKALRSKQETARRAAEYDLIVNEGGMRLSRNEEDARREGPRRALQPDFQDLQVPPIQQSVYAPEFGNVDRPAVTGQPSEGSPEAAGEWAMPSKVGPEPQRGKLLSRNEIDELKAQGEGSAVKSGKYEPAYDKTLFGEKLPSVKAPEQDRTHYGTTDKPVAKPGGGAADYTPDWQVGQTQEGKRVSTSEVLARQATAYDQSKVEPKPLTPQVTESVIKPLLSETDSATAIKKIKGVYETLLKPEFGVHDVVLSKLTDESLQQQILSHLQEGSGLNDAVLKTTQGIRNALAEAAQKSEGRIITPEVKSIFAKIKAKQGQQLGSFPDVSIIGDYAEIGYHIAKNLLKAGALKLSEWRDTVLQTFKTEGIDLDDSQLSQLEQRMRSMLASEDSGDGDTLHTAQRARLTKSVENLGHLNEGWDALPETSKGTNKSPLDRVTLWRNDILERNEKFSKYPEVDEAILTSAGRLQHNGQTWVSPEGKVYSDVQAKRYLRTSADLAYKAATKKEQGGQEVAYDEVQSEQGGVAQKKLDTFKDLNEANVRADELNKAVPANADYSYEGGIQGRTTKSPKYVVYKTYKKRESLDENFRPSREQPDETDKLITDKEAVPTGEESDPTREGTDLEQSLYKTTEEGEAIDPLEEIESIGDKVRASSNESSGDVVQQHLSDVFNTVLGRLDPIQLYLEGQVRKPGELVARTKLMVQHLMDARVDLDAKGLDWSKFVAEANPKLADEFKFQSDKQANNWWNGTGRDFFKSWISKQPEIKSILGGKKVEAESVGTGPSVVEAIKAREPKPDEVRLDAVSEARITATDFLRSYFSRRGLGPELSQRSTDAVQKLARAAAFFHGSERAEVRLDSLPPDVAGTAIDASIGGTWSPLIRLNKDITSDSFLSVVAGHESFETLLHAINRGESTTNATRSVQNAIEQATNYSVADRRALLDVAARTLPKDVDRQLLSGLLDYSAADPKEFVSTLAGIHVVDSTTKGGLARFADTLLYGDGYISRALSSVVDTAQSLVNAFRGVTSASREGLISDFTTPLKADLKHFNDLFKTVRNSEKAIQDAVSKLTTIDAMQPASFWDAKASGFIPNVERSGDRGIDDATAVAYARINPEEQKVSKLGYAFAPFDQVAQTHPVFKPHLSAMLDYEGLANDTARELNSSYFTRDHVRGQTKLGPAGEALKAITSSPKIREAANELKLNQNFLGRELNQTELKDLWIKHNLDPSERALVAKESAAARERNIKAGQLIVRSNRTELVNATAAVLMSGHDTAHQDAFLAAERLVAIGTAQAGLSQLPAGVDPLRLVSSITTELGIPAEKLTVAQFALQPMLQKHAELAQLISSKEGFTSEQRFGRFAASFNVEGQARPGRVSGNSIEEVRANLAKVKGKIVGDPTFYDNNDRAKVGLDPAISAKLNEVGEAALQQRLQTLSPEDAQIVRSNLISHDAAIEKELYTRGVKRWTQKRNLAPGRETLDLFENDFQYNSVLPHALAKQNIRSRSEVILQDPIFQQNPAAAKHARQQVQNMLSTDSAWSRRAREFSFIYQIGLSPVVIATEQVQPLLALPAHLTQNGAGVAKGYEYVLKGYSETIKSLFNDKYSDPFVQNMIVQLDKSGSLSQQTIGTILDPSDVNAINLSRTLGGKIDQKTALEIGKNAVSYISGLARAVQSFSSGLSSRVTVVAASLHAKDLIASGDLPPEKAFDYVRNALVVSAPGTSGRAGKPTGIYSGEESRSAVGVLLSLQGYVHAMTAMQARLIKEAVASRSLSSASSKAAVQMAATQLIAAGVLGLPGVGLAINVLNQTFPDLNVKSNLKTWIAKTTSDDEETGKFISDLTLRGLPQTLSPVDVSSRLSLSSMLGVSDYDGFSLSHLLGAPGGIVNNLFRSSQQAIHGEYGDAFQTAAPTAIRNVLKAFRDDGAVRKPDGSLTYQPSAGEQFAQAIGFTPKKVAELREFNTLAAQMEKSAGNDQQRFISKTADLLRSGDLAGVRAALLEREHANPDEFSAAEGLKLVVRQMQDQTYPEDPRRGGSKLTLNDRADLLRTYGLAGVAPSESARLSQSAQIMQQFGLVGSIDQSDLMKAGYVDLLMQKNPQMTRQQARKKVEEMTRRKPLPTLGTM